MLIIKHGEGLFEHAYVTKSGFIMLALLMAAFLIVLMKIGISDLVGWKK